MTDPQRIELRNRFLRGSARVAVALGALQLTVRILGDTIIWILAVRTAHQGYEAVTYPEMPWGLVESIASFLVLSLIGAAFWKNQIGEPGRVIDLILGMLPSSFQGGRE